MKVISHRGNLHGSIPERENTIEYILNALAFFDVEIDVRIKSNELYLGHDEPQQKLELDFLLAHKNQLWIHCKDIESLSFLTKFNLNYFGHQNDEFVLTSKGFIFTSPNSKQSHNSVTVMPELSDNKNNLSKFAVLTDYPFKYSPLPDSEDLDLYLFKCNL